MNYLQMLCEQESLRSIKLKDTLFKSYRIIIVRFYNKVLKLNYVSVRKHDCLTLFQYFALHPLYTYIVLEEKRTVRYTFLHNKRTVSSCFILAFGLSSDRILCNLNGHLLSYQTSGTPFSPVLGSGSCKWN
jgi:hypothetical protein